METPEATPQRTVLLTVQYDGTRFSGWQRQATERTVQGDLTDAVADMVHHPVTMHSSSRTDAGVHARAMPVAFDTTRDIPLYGFVRGINSKLGLDAAVLDAREAEPGFRPRFAAVAKTYRFHYQLGQTRRPLQNRQAVWVRQEDLDLDAMRAAADAMLGEHDFAAFRSAGCDAKTTRRRMYRLDVSQLPDSGLVRIEVTGNAFMRNMVRIMAGTLLAVGKGQLSPSRIPALLAEGNRTEAGMTAPPHGLTLWAVHFDGYPRLGKPDRLGPEAA